MTTQACQNIARNIGGLFTCTESVNGYVQIRTPYLYPDGDIIDLFYKEQESGEILLTDFGETTRWLRMQSFAKKRSQKQNKLIDDICQTLGIELFRGMLLVRAKPETLADDLTRLAQASIRVADLWFTLRGNLQIPVLEEVNPNQLENWFSWQYTKHQYHSWQYTKHQYQKDYRPSTKNTRTIEAIFKPLLGKALHG